MKPTFVLHDGDEANGITPKRFRVVAEVDIDGDPGYELARPFNRGQNIVARVSECQPYVRQKRMGPRVRTIIVDDIVMTWKGGRGVEMRLKGTRDTYPINLDQIFDCAAKIRAMQDLARKKAEREARRRR